jgi:HAD superfamily hydrolase (TIGR01450 family)
MTSQDAARLLAEKRNYLIDLDGVVYEGSSLITGAGEALEFFRLSGKKIFFLTNNSTQHPKSLVEKLRKLGVPCAPQAVLNSGAAVALYVRKNYLDAPHGVFLVGSQEFRALLIESGVKISDDPTACSALVAGMDLEFNYKTIALGLTALQRGVPFIACNRDANYPSDKGVLMPGCGAMIGALEAASMRRADHVIGKPSPLMLELALERLGTSTANCLVFGDTLDTDIAMATAAGVSSILIQPPGIEPTVCLAGVKPTAHLASLKEAAELLGRTSA